MKEIRVQERFDQLWAKVCVGEKPVVKFNPRLRTTAGRCFYTEGVIELNPKIDIEFLLEDTLPHELAHLIAWRYHGEAGHGQHWKNACKAYGMKEVTRCHNQPVERTTQRRWEYKCGCGTHKVATVTHNKMVKGQHRRCVQCEQRITFTGKEIV